MFTDTDILFSKVLDAHSFENGIEIDVRVVDEYATPITPDILEQIIAQYSSCSHFFLEVIPPDSSDELIAIVSAATILILWYLIHTSYNRHINYWFINNRN